MTKQEFNHLTTKGVILLDGATGSNMRLTGMPVGIPLEQWVLEHPEILRDSEDLCRRWEPNCLCGNFCR